MCALHTDENEEDLPDQTQTQVETPTDVEGISKAESGKEAEVQVVIVGDVLSNTQLVLRRGGAIFVMLLILAAGILINEILTGLLRGN